MVDIEKTLNEICSLNLDESIHILISTLIWALNSSIEEKSGHFPNITYHRVCHKSNMTGATSGAGRTVDPSRAPEFTPGCSGVRVAQSFVFCVWCCRLFFVLLLFSIGHCIARPSIYGFGLLAWCHRTFLYTCLHQIIVKLKLCQYAWGAVVVMIAL